MKVSICCITYNHEKYIAQALDGFLKQKTNFDYEIVIGEDCSKDKTLEIIKSYQLEYPDRIKLLEHGTNIGMMPNFIETLQECSGKFIALCEGDDYWTDEYKLQKQVDFLEANGDFAICFHRVYELSESEEPMLSNLKSFGKEVTYTIEDLAESNFIHTASVLFRNGLFGDIPSWFIDSPVGDYPLHMLNARYGLIKFLPEPMAVYRRHNTSVWSRNSYLYQITNLLKVIEFLIKEFKSHNTVAEKLKLQKFVYLNNIGKEFLKSNDFEKFKKYLSETVKNNQGFIMYWVEKEYFNLMKEKEEANKKIAIIKNSTTYRLLKRLRIFK